MRTRWIALTVLLSLSFCLFQFQALAQGPLTPPGPPGSTLRTLEQIEPRVPLSGNSIQITAPGSYYLTSDVGSGGMTTGITISADNVTLDLNGFSVIGNGTLFVNGIDLTGTPHNIVIKNGTVRNWGSSGIDMHAGSHCRIVNVRATDNSGAGIHAGADLVVKDCTTSRNLGWGIIPGYGTVVENCIANHCQYGISENHHPIRIVGCTVYSNTVTGIECGNSSWVASCHVFDNGIYGIAVGGSGNLIEKNKMTGNGSGLNIIGSSNDIRGNVVAGNATNYTIAAGNHLSLLISELPEALMWPASVKLTGNLAVPPMSPGLLVLADNVTIDLNGHVIVGDPDSGPGIQVPDLHTGLVIKNGTIRNCGGAAIDAMQAEASRATDVLCLENGGYGVHLGKNALIRGCVARGNGGQGIHAGRASAIRDCIADGNGDAGIVGEQGSVLENCTAHENTGVGLATASGTIQGSAAWMNTSDGIYATDGSAVRMCSAYDNRGNGVFTGQDCVVANCTATGNGANGCRMGARSHVSDCAASLNTSNGFYAEEAGGTLRDCTAEYNGADGILTSGYIRIADCRTAVNGSNGIRVSHHSQVTGCQTDQNGTSSISGSGLFATGDRNRIRNNSAVSNDQGIRVIGYFNLIVKNSASGSTPNFSITAGHSNSYGIILTNPGAGFSGSADYSWANIEF